jgi:diguanylate cyclase (GGDEF)-like protein
VTTLAEPVAGGKHHRMNYPVMVNRGNSLDGPAPKTMPKFKSRSKSRSKTGHAAGTSPRSVEPKPSKTRPSKTRPSKTKPSKLKFSKPRLASLKPARKPAVRLAQSPNAQARGPSAGQNLSKASDPAAKLKARLRRLTAQLAKARGRIQELEAWAETDFLLDILNRRGVERELKRAIGYIGRYGASGALIALDVDRLKPINDSFGHAAGDAVLKGVVNVVLRHVRSSDVVGRLGGDEFVVLLWNLSEADALAKAATIEQAIDRLTFVFRGRSLTAGASTGVAVLSPEDDVVAALERADRAMYARKKIRRDRIQ